MNPNENFKIPWISTFRSWPRERFLELFSMKAAFQKSCRKFKKFEVNASGQQKRLRTLELSSIGKQPLVNVLC